MNRSLAKVLLVSTSLVFAQSPPSKNSVRPSQGNISNPEGGNSHGLGLSDLLTNARLKVQKELRCVLASDLSSDDLNKIGIQLEAAAKRTCQVDGNEAYRSAQGVWKSEVPGRDLILPEQVSILCWADEKRCRILRVTFDVDQQKVSIDGPDETDYHIVSWDSRGLLATHDPDGSDWCHRNVLSMNFAVGEVSLSDIPTHEKGCEIFRDTNSYWLIPGKYYVDTTAHNDLQR